MKMCRYDVQFEGWSFCKGLYYSAKLRPQWDRLWQKPPVIVKHGGSKHCFCRNHEHILNGNKKHLWRSSNWILPLSVLINRRYKCVTCKQSLHQYAVSSLAYPKIKGFFFRKKQHFFVKEDFVIIIIVKAKPNYHFCYWKMRIHIKCKW